VVRKLLSKGLASSEVCLCLAFAGEVLLRDFSDMAKADK